MSDGGDMVPEKGKGKKQSIVDRLSEEQAHEVLRLVAESDPKISRVIEEIAARYLSDVDAEAVAEDVYLDLDLIDVEEVWDRSGSTRFGYVDPGEAAWELFEETLKPYIEDISRYLDLSMDQEAKELCKGVMMGIRRFGEESSTPFREWAEGVPDEYVRVVLCEWKKGCGNKKDVEELETFID